MQPAIVYAYAWLCTRLTWSPIVGGRVGSLRGVALMCPVLHSPTYEICSGQHYSGSDSFVSVSTLFKMAEQVCS